MNENQLKFLWDNYANNKGFSGYDEFKSLMANDNNRKLFFDDSNKELGFKDYNEFEGILGVKKKGGTTKDSGQLGEPSAQSFGQKITEKIATTGTQIPFKTEQQQQKETSKMLGDVGAGYVKKQEEKKQAYEQGGATYEKVKQQEAEERRIVEEGKREKKAAEFKGYVREDDVFKMPTRGESQDYAGKVTDKYINYLLSTDPEKGEFERNKYSEIKAKSKEDRDAEDEEYLRRIEADALDMTFRAKEQELANVADQIDNLQKTAVTSGDKQKLDYFYREYERLRGTLQGIASASSQNKFQYGKIAGRELQAEEEKQKRFQELQAGDGKTVEFFKGIGNAVNNGIISLYQVPKVLGDLVGDTDYDWADELYDLSAGAKKELDIEFGAPLPQGKSMADLPPTARIAVVGGNAIGSAALFAAGGGLGGTTTLGQAAATFGTAFLTSEADYYQQALDAGMNAQDAAVAGSYLAAQTALVESIIPDIKYFSSGPFRKSVMQGIEAGIRSGGSVKEIAKLAFKNAVKATPESVLSYAKSATKEAGEEVLGQVGEDVGKEVINAVGQREYFNDTFDGEAYADAIIGGLVSGGGLSIFSRPTPKSPVQEETMREILDRRFQDKLKGTASDKIGKEDTSALDDATKTFDAMSSHSGWNNMSREEQNHAFALAQQVEVMKKEQERMKELRIPDERKDAEIKKLEDEVNQMFSMQMEQDKEKAKDAKLKAIEDEFNKSIEGEEFPVQEDERDQEIVDLQKQREERGVNELDTFFSDMKPMVPFAVERIEQGQPVAQSVKQASSNYLYKKYKELTEMKSNPNRMMTRQQIANVQKQLEQDIRTLEGTAEVKPQVNDQENVQGIPSEVGKGQEPVAAKPVEVTSEEAPATGGVLQTQGQEEVVAPQVTEESAPKPARKTRLARMFETSEGETAAGKVADFLKESNIGVEVLDTKAFEEAGKQRNFEGGADGIFLVDNNTGKIYLNQEKIKTAEGKTIAFHEGIHPVVNIIRNTNPKQYQAIVQGLKAEAAKNNAVAEAAAAVAASEYYQEQGPLAIEDETVVETMARVAAGDIDIDTFEPTFREKFIDFMNKLAKMLGLNPIAVNSPRVEVKRFADQLTKALNEGGKISDIVGKKNVGKFQNTISDGQYSIDARIADKGVQVPRSEKLPLKIVASKEEDVMRRINELLDKYPNALTDKEQWKELMSRVFPITVDGEVFIPAFPEGLARMAGSVQETLKEINKVSDEQRKLASEGLKGTKEIGELYKQGKMDEVDTGLYFLWNIMSIGISPYPQESGFLQAVNGGVDKYIKLAAAGKFNENTLKEYLNWVDGVLPKGTPGAGSKSNLNSFGKSFLSKAAQEIESGEFEGKTKLQALHEILSDRKTPTNELRRKWQANMSAMQFNNKIFDFILLTTGRSDLFVTDRVRVDHFWDGNNFKKKRGLKESTSLYDGSDLTYGAAAGAGFSKILSDVPGLVFNELANRTMTPIVEKAYKQIGVKDYPEVGRFHWETWVAASSQEVSHGSIDAIVQRKEKGEIQDAGIRQGKYGAWDFNFAYKKRAGKDFVYEFVDNDGNTYVFDKINDIQDEIEKQKKKTYETNNRFLLPDAKGNISRPTKGLSTAWYDTELVDAEKYFEFLRSKAKEIIPAPDVVEDQGVVIERPKSEKISKEKKPTGQPSIGILRGKRPTKAEVNKYLSEQEFFRSTSPFAWAVDPVSEETLKKSRIVENEGTYGVVTEDGDIKGVFNPNAAKQREGVPAKKNTLAGLIPKAINAGGIKLDNFDGRLTELYSKNGFRKVSSVPFNEEYAPEGWSKEKDGTPDVVSMVYDPDNKLDIEFKKFDDYGDMISYRDSFVDQARKEVDKKWGEKKMIALTKRDELGTKADREIAAYASKFLNKFGPYTKANVIQIMNMSAEEKIKLINDTFEAKFKRMKPEPGDPENYFYEQGVKRRDQVLALVGKPTVQPSIKIDRQKYLIENPKKILTPLKSKYSVEGGDCYQIAIAVNDVFGGDFYAIVRDDEPEYYHHVAIKIDGKYYDGTGVRAESEIVSDFSGYDPDTERDEQAMAVPVSKEDVIRTAGKASASLSSVDKIKDELLESIPKPTVQPSMVKRTPIKWEKSPEGKGDPSISSRNPVVTEAANKLKEGKITNEEYRATVSENSPILPITRFFEPATIDEINNAFEVASKKESDAEKIDAPVADGTVVGLRLDIPSYKSNNTWVVSVHDGNTAGGKVISYSNVAKIKDVDFSVTPKGALNIAAGVAKTTIGRMYGKWENIPGANMAEKGENAKDMVNDIVNDPSYVQVGMNPFRHSYFYDRSSDIGRPIMSAEEVIQIGGLVYAKNPVYGNWTDEAFEVKGMLDASGKTVQFSGDIKRTPAQIRQAVEDGVDAVEAAIAEGMDPQQAVDENISSQDWYGDLSAAQKQQLNEILQDEFGATASEPKLQNNAQRVADLWERGGKEAKAEIKNILETDPELSYIYNNFPKITKQLQEQGLLTKTENCP